MCPLWQCTIPALFFLATIGENWNEIGYKFKLHTFYMYKYLWAVIWIPIPKSMCWKLNRQCKRWEVRHNERYSSYGASVPHEWAHDISWEWINCRESRFVKNVSSSPSSQLLLTTNLCPLPSHHEMMRNGALYYVALLLGFPATRTMSQTDLVFINTQYGVRGSENGRGQYLLCIFTRSSNML